LTKARRALRDAVLLARESDLSDDHCEFLTDTIAQVRAELDLLSLAATGATHVDWDAELAKLSDA
jgi:hypothetical protein